LEEEVSIEKAASTGERQKFNHWLPKIDEAINAVDDRGAVELFDFIIFLGAKARLPPLSAMFTSPLGRGEYAPRPLREVSIGGPD
jgi:hypothetical protein